MSITFSDVAYMGGTAYDVGIEAVLVSEDNYAANYQVDVYGSMFLHAGETVTLTQYLDVTGFDTATWSGVMGDGNAQKTFSKNYKIIKSNTTSKQIAFKVTGNVNGYVLTVTVWATVSQGNWHTIMFDANGGTGAPGAQIKVYGYVLTLSSTVPTRKEEITNPNDSSIKIVRYYDFTGWKSSYDNKIFQPGQAYGYDVQDRLYAQWAPRHNKPNVTLGRLYRVVAQNSDVESSTGEYVRCEVTISLDRAFYSDNEMKSVSSGLAIDGETSTKTATLTLKNTVSKAGEIIYTYTAAFALATSSRAYLTVFAYETATENYGSATGAIGTANIPLEFAHGGGSVGLLTSANELESISLGSLTLQSVHDPTQTSIPISVLCGLLLNAIAENKIDLLNSRRGLYPAVHSTVSGIWFCGNFSGATNPNSGDKLITLRSAVPFTNTGGKLLRGAFPNQQSGLWAYYSDDKHSIDLCVEQAPSFNTGYTVSCLIPCYWTLESV